MYKKVPVIVFIAIILAVLPVLTQLCTPAYAEDSESECWAVIIGVSEYKKYQDAPGCAEGAEQLSQQLGPIWGEENVQLLLDSEATKTKIHEAVNWLVSNEDGNDTVLFYYSGHSDKGYIASYNAYYESTWISSRELANWLRPLESERVTIILDTCYAAAFNNKLSGSGRVILASSQANELSYSAGGDSVFTYYILEALDEFDIADANYNYELSAEELFQYAEPETIEQTEDYPKGTQHPVMSDDYSGELSLLVKFIFSTEPSLPSDTDILFLDDVAYSSVPLELIWAPGSVHSFTVLSPLDNGSGTGYVFTSWSDGDTSTSRTISHGGAYTANYKTQYKLLIESDYGKPEGQGWYDEGSTANISVTSVEEPTTKHIFTGWSGDFSGSKATASVIMDSPKTVRANWRTEYLLTIESAHGEPKGEGWYDEGSTANISVTSSIEEPTAKHFFTGWSGDYSGNTPTVSVTMDSPKTIKVNWQSEYLLTIESEYGEPEGAGWYDEGSTANISVAPSEGLIIKHIFTGWSGDISGTELTVTLTVNSPITVTANWRNEYTGLYILISGVVVLAAATIIGLRIRRRRKSI